MDINAELIEKTKAIVVDIPDPRNETVTRRSVAELRLRPDWAEDEAYQPYLVELNIITLVNLERRVIQFAPTRLGHVVHPDDWEGFVEAFKESRAIAYTWHGAVEG